MTSAPTRSKKCPVCGSVFTSEPNSSRLILISKVDRHVRNSHLEYKRSTEGWSRRLSLIFSVGLLVMIFLSNLNPQGLAISTLAFGLAIAAGVFLRWRSIRNLKQSWQETHGSPLSQSEVGPELQATLDVPYLDDSNHAQDSSQEDPQILELARELCRQFNITKFVPNVIKWLPRIESEHCTFGLFDADEVDLPRTLRGRLEVEEWKAIIASSLVYDFKLSRERFIGLAARNLSGLALLIFFVITAAVAFSETFSLAIRAVAGILSLFFVILPIVLSLWLSASYRQRLQLKADRIAADTVGRSALVGALTKIKQLGLYNIERLEAGGWKSRFSRTPRMSRRISNLGP